MLSDEELDRLRELARTSGLSQSSLLRTALYVVETPQVQYAAMAMRAKKLG